MTLRLAFLLALSVSVSASANEAGLDGGAEGPPTPAPVPAAAVPAAAVPAAEVAPAQPASALAAPALAAPALAAPALAAPAVAAPAVVGTRIDVTSTTIGAFHAPNNNRTSCDDNYGELLERLNVNGSHGNWVAGLRLDSSAYLSRPRTSDESGLPRPCLAVELANRYQEAFTPEKLWVGWSGTRLEITAGDSYVSFGRGLSLSLRKTDELGLDTTQRGLRVKLNTDRVTATLVGGFTNIGNLDEASGRTARDPNDLVLGGQADVRLTEGVRVGAHLVSFMFNQPVSTNVPPGEDHSFQERWVSAGPTLDAPRLTPWLGVYLEGIGQYRWTVDGRLESGYGLYGTSTVHLRPVTLLFEGKLYGDLVVVQPRFENKEFQPVQYASPPTVERPRQEIEHSQRRIGGGRVKADWSISPSVAVYANLGLFRDDEGYLDPETVEVKSGTIYDPYAGVDARVGPVRITATAGWRSVYLAAVRAPIRSDGHVDVAVVGGFGGTSSVELHLLHLERRKVLPLATENWREGTMQVSYRLRPWFAVSGILDYTTEKGFPSVWYPGGTAEVNFTPSSQIRIFVGSSRGGLRCVSGVCRIFPPFQGAKATVTLRF